MGMGLVVGALQALGGDVGIDLGGDQMGVAEHLLHRAEIGPGVEQVGGEAVPEFVGGQSGIELGADEVFLQLELDESRKQGAGIGKLGVESRFIVCEGARQAVPVGADGLDGWNSDGDQAFLFSLAAGQDQPLLALDVAHAKGAELADAQAAGIKQLEHGGVAKERLGLDGFVALRAGGLPEGSAGAGEEKPHLLHGGEAGEPLGELGHGQILDGGGGDFAAGDQKLVEGAQGGEAQLDAGAAVVVAAQNAEVGAKVVAFKAGPWGRGLAVAAMPCGELPKGLGVVADGVRGGGPLAAQVLQELDARWIEFRCWCFPRFHAESIPKKLENRKSCP